MDKIHQTHFHVDVEIGECQLCGRVAVMGTRRAIHRRDDETLDICKKCHNELLRQIFGEGEPS